jgi:hypothetical protein
MDPLSILDLIKPRMGGAGTIASPRTSGSMVSSTPMADPLAAQQQPDISSLMAGVAGSVDGTGPLRTVNGVTMVAPAIRSLVQLKKQLGLPVFGNVVSDYRTRAEQAALYQQYLNGTGNLAAPPGQSNHETGNAVDIASSWLSQNPQVRQWLLAHGWTNDVPGEPWHWEYGV